MFSLLIKTLYIMFFINYSLKNNQRLEKHLTNKSYLEKNYALYCGI